MTNAEYVKEQIMALDTKTLAAMLMQFDDLDDKLHFCPRENCIKGSCRPCLISWLEREQ